MIGQKIRQPSIAAVTRARPPVPRLRAESGPAIQARIAKLAGAHNERVCVLEVGWVQAHATTHASTSGRVSASLAERLVLDTGQQTTRRW